jgi:phosphoribosylamine--glycine ligase
VKILVVGNGGREHALVLRLAHEGHEIIAAPGNPGISRTARLCDARIDDLDRLVEIAIAERPDLVVVGPEAPLASGLADRLTDLQIAVFGPCRDAARLESSKAFAKAVMTRAAVPTADFVTASSEREADDAFARFSGRCAVKADGLAAGKGVVVCSTVDGARAAARAWLPSGAVIVEERLEGPEVSVIALTDGERLVLLPPARDHKRLGEGDTGLNTGGMGAVCPVPLPTETLAFVRDRVMHPVLRVLRDAGTPFRGALYAGLMLTPSGPRVLEFNARFGDPETQAILAALPDDFSLARELLAAASGRVKEGVVEAARAACAVVVASEGYPAAPVTGKPIEGVAEAERDGARVLHAGTRFEDGRLVSAGGRVLSVVATGPTLAEARRTATAAAARVRLEGAQHRRDIGATTGERIFSPA